MAESQQIALTCAVTESPLPAATARASKPLLTLLESPGLKAAQAGAAAGLRVAGGGWRVAAGGWRRRPALPELLPDPGHDLWQCARAPYLSFHGNKMRITDVSHLVGVRQRVINENRLLGAFEISAPGNCVGCGLWGGGRLREKNQTFNIKTGRRLQLLRATSFAKQKGLRVGDTGRPRAPGRTCHGVL